MLTETQIEKFLNGEAKIAYPTIMGPRMIVTARFVRYGSEGWWMTRREDQTAWDKEWVSTAKAYGWAKSSDIREAA